MLMHTLRRHWYASRLAEGPLKHFYAAPIPGAASRLNSLQILSLDLETTGLDAKRDTILSAGWISLDARRVLLGSGEHHLVRPDSAISASSAVIHAITDDMAAEGEELCDVVAQLLQALPKADHVALCLPLTPETRHIVAERELRAMKPSTYIYNVGRGASIEPKALLQALTEEWIAGAGLDVTDQEPLPEDSPLWDMPNVLLGQHSSGSSPLNADRITDIFLENLGRYVRGDPLINVVDRGLGY